ncbi:MAG: hypothetical protein LBO72_04865 [Helicobacteraceae bacterium]|jgi:hypothetical protein|nr:hypothetical protein [Helicobacteraceae bacterium]
MDKVESTIETSCVNVRIGNRPGLILFSEQRDVDYAIKHMSSRFNVDVRTNTFPIYGHGVEGYSSVKYEKDESKSYEGNDITAMQALVERMRKAGFRDGMRVHLYVCYGAKQPTDPNVDFPLAQYLANALPKGTKVTSSTGRYAFDGIVNLALGKQCLTTGDELTFTHQAGQNQ